MSGYYYDGGWATNSKLVHYGGIAYCVSENGCIIKSMNLEQNITFNGFGMTYAGIANQNYGTISECYSIGGNETFSGDKYGISKGGIIEDCYYDKSILGNSSNSETDGTPKSTLAMKMEATYKNWDFENVWTIDESEENPINDGYPYLRVFYEDVENPVTVSSISSTNGKLIIDTKITDVSEDYTLHIALYDSENRLCDYLAIPNDRQLKDVFAVYTDNCDAAYAKIFTWYSADILEPVSTCETVAIER